MNMDMPSLAISTELRQSAYVPTADLFGSALVDFVQERACWFRPDFPEWLEENLHIWTAFKAQADRVWDRGRTHYSARTIIEFLRHETAIAEAGGEYKINDHGTPDLARLYHLIHPERQLFAMRNDRRTS